MEPGEELEQARFIKLPHHRGVRELAPALCWMLHTSNGGKRDAITVARCAPSATQRTRSPHASGEVLGLRSPPRI
jgi:hypothetical protein